MMRYCFLLLLLSKWACLSEARDVSQAMDEESLPVDDYEQDPQAFVDVTVDGLYGSNMEVFNKLLGKLLSLRREPQSTLEADGRGKLKDIRRPPNSADYYLQFYKRRDLVEYVVATIYRDFGGPAALVAASRNRKKEPSSKTEAELLLESMYTVDGFLDAMYSKGQMYGAKDTMAGFYTVLEKLLALRSDPQSTVDMDGQGKMFDIRPETRKPYMGQNAYYDQFYRRRDLLEYMVRTLHKDFGGPDAFMDKLETADRDTEGERKGRAYLQLELEQLAETNTDKFNLAVLEFLELAPNARDRQESTDIWYELQLLLGCDGVDQCLGKLATHDRGLQYLVWRLLHKDESHNLIPVTTLKHLSSILRKVKRNPNPRKTPTGASGIDIGNNLEFRWMRIEHPVEFAHGTEVTFDPQVILRNASYFAYSVLAIAAAVFLRDRFTKKKNEAAAAAAAAAAAKKKNAQKGKKESRKKKKS